MKTELFDYNLPPERIAQEPVEPRDASRLMYLNRRTGEVKHYIFRQIEELLNENDVLVFNDTRVFPGRLEGKFITGGKAELLLLRKVSQTDWISLVKPARKFRAGKKIVVSDKVTASVVEYIGKGLRRIRFSGGDETDIDIELRKTGKVPLPPYIKKELHNGERYQTVYAREEKSAAAPTAGLHFTPELIERLKHKGIEMIFITLHIGLATFNPIKTENIEDHVMHAEEYEISDFEAEQLNNAISKGKRIVAVGTTVVRALESSCEKGKIIPGKRETSLYIKPCYRFKVVDALITNFHLPRSSLLVLVSAFAGYENIMNAYKIAIQEGYRFFSFGDAMFIE